MEEVGVNVPVVVRLGRQQRRTRREKRRDSGLNIIAAKSLTDAAQRDLLPRVEGNNVRFN